MLFHLRELNFSICLRGHGGMRFRNKKHKICYIAFIGSLGLYERHGFWEQTYIVWRSSIYAIELMNIEYEKF